MAGYDFDGLNKVLRPRGHIFQKNYQWFFKDRRTGRTKKFKGKMSFRKRTFL